mmetsp:Transcript_53608/g.61516  ORF Transcript_53608/g.61516 Transcript_53608/m.61516 type:complete len:193 (+) Transcript_53608:57-635(+)
MEQLIQDSNHTQNAIDMSKKILELLSKVTERNSRLQQFKKKIIEGKISIMKNQLQNTKTLTDFQGKIVKEIQNNKESCQKEVIPSQKSENQVLVTKVKDRLTFVKKELDKLLFDIDDIDETFAGKDHPEIRVIKEDYISSNKKFEDKLKEFKDDEEDNRLESVAYNIKVSDSSSLGGKFISKEDLPIIEIEF